MNVVREGRPRNPPYARARVRPFDALVEQAVLHGGTTDEWKGLVREFRRLGNKYAWQKICARRTSAVAVTLRRLEAVLGERYAGRARVSTGTCWAVAAMDELGNAHVVARVRATKARTLDELRAPVVIEVLHPILDAGRLARLTRR